MSKCGWCNGTGRVGSLFLGEQCPSCEGTGMVMDQKMTETKIDGLMIKCGTKSLWVCRETVEDMLSGKSSSAAGHDITVVPHVVKVG